MSTAHEMVARAVRSWIGCQDWSEGNKHISFLGLGGTSCRKYIARWQSSSQSRQATLFLHVFFVNNQHRILLEASGVGSQELENIFESNLTRVGQMVAILDTWDQPTYLTRQLGPQKPRSLFKSVLLSRVLQLHRFYQ